VRAGYRPASRRARFAGVRTFARLPLVDDPSGVDVAVVGIPFDNGTTNRSGARFGPEAIRSASTVLRLYNPAQRTAVFDAVSVADFGDLEVTLGNTERAVGQIAEQLDPLVSAGVRTLCFGGDHLVVLGELRALAMRHGPLGLVLLDAHADVYDDHGGERYFHGSPFLRALEEGLLDPARSVLSGMRGSSYGPDDDARPVELGFEIIDGDELVGLDPREWAERVRTRVAEGPTFFSFDVDVLDPVFAPGTGTPEVGGLTTREALAFVRSLAGIRFEGFDVVEVSPPYDGPGAVTALAAATVGFDFLTLAALA
jgi:agmatinase